MEKISKNISYKEAVHSNTAKRKGLDNTPNDKQIAAMMTVAEMVFQPLREWAAGPIKINSFLDFNISVENRFKLMEIGYKTVKNYNFY